MILDTETTGLDDAEIVEIAIIDRLGEMLLDTLIKPSIVIPPEVTAIDGISDAMVADAPTFPEVYPRIAEVLEDKRILIYNASFDWHLELLLRTPQSTNFKAEKALRLLDGTGSAVERKLEQLLQRL